MPHDEVSQLQRTRARELRRAMTRAETLLWRHLKAHRLARLGGSRGYRMLRFTNDDVMKNLEGVALAILQAAEPGAPLSLTLPRKGGGNGESGASDDSTVA